MRNDAISILGLKQAKQAKTTHQAPYMEVLLQEAMLSLDISQQHLYSHTH